MERVYNFSAGPSVLPGPVLEKVQQELLSYGGSGMSVLEMSHRSEAFTAIIRDAESLLRQLMGIPDNYKVLFMQGGASLQFSMVPLNLLNGSRRAGYADTGSWSKKAIKEAEKSGTVTVLASSEGEGYSRIPALDLSSASGFDYIHITTNNTIEGTRYAEIPDTGDIPLVADMSSNILSEAVDVSKFGLIYAGAQKNLGPAGLTVVIVREDLLGRCGAACPAMLDYGTYAQSESLYNTPPTFAIYVTKLVLEWLRDAGGVEEMEKANRGKAARLYAAIDGSDLFENRVEAASRSLMNVPFTAPTDELNREFLQFAASNGLKTLKGHRSVGGMRASIYNAMPLDGVQALIDCMQTFERTHRQGD
ncbi:3-phosphoserine/phosphohydroxythreonine transaminase [Indiicoccus explosivorum]|uniref:3-phosphoserine/phosphohydroxythreonine transaminase n=1 Tax=Indiicoccus explosivorum TaxID=1917864 RepID=UPI000B449BD9|nr:3-phosphoserine/phosphohydroxythreonine transaminase [Indiicoccus explosivorum]